jgi:hypothetical protein
MACLTWSSSVMSAGTTRVLTPYFLHSASVSSSCAFVRDSNATSAPVSANAIAVARPIPLPAPYNQCHQGHQVPVIKATSPLNEKFLGEMAG